MHFNVHNFYVFQHYLYFITIEESNLLLHFYKLLNNVVIIDMDTSIHFYL